MIQLNNKKYDNYNQKITWGNFCVVSNGVERKGRASFVQFSIETIYL